MKIRFRTLASATLACAMLLSGALADSIAFNGVVAAGDEKQVYAHIGGVVEEVLLEEGQSVKAGEAIATLKTTKVYATTDGTVTGIFGEVGESAETVGERYGAVLYIEGDSDYSVSASTENAYNTTETKFVHVGEMVYLKCRSDGDHTGTGVITAIEGEDYSIDVKSGAFIVDESVDVFRADSYKAAVRIGRGTVGRKNPTAVNGTGGIVSIAVKNGDSVKKGDLLMETLDGSFDGLYMSGKQILAGDDGVIGALNVQAGKSVQKDEVAAVIYPLENMRVEAEIPEGDLGAISEGDSVVVELIWNQDDEVRYAGKISMISCIASAENAATEGESEVSYTVYVDFTADEHTRFGMSAVVSTLDADEEAVADDVA